MEKLRNGWTHKVLNNVTQKNMYIMTKFGR